MRRAFRLIDRLASRISSELRIAGCKLRYGGFRCGKGVKLGRGVEVTVLNGATLSIGDRSVIEANCHLRSDGRLEIGPDSFVGRGTVIVAADTVVIGADALIASGCVIRDQDHGRGQPYRTQPLVSAPVSLGRNVWLGANAVVLKGVRIGDNTIVGAGAVVTKSVPAGAIAAGVPAKTLSSQNGGLSPGARTHNA